MSNIHGERLSWANFKIHLDAGLPFKEIPLPGSIRLIAVDGDSKFQTVIHTDGDMPTEYTDYTDNYAANKNKLINVVPEPDVNGNLINYVTIQEESSDPTKRTGGHFQAESFEVTIPAATGWSSQTQSFPFPIALLSAQWTNSKAENEGDRLEVKIGANTTIGAITSDVSSGTEISVNQTVIDNTAVGFHVDIFDGTNEDDLGRVLAVDPDNMTITVEDPVTSSFLASTPTYIKQTIIMIPKLRLNGDQTIILGSTKIGASFIPANTEIKVRYDNISGTAKTFSVIMEYLY